MSENQAPYNVSYIASAPEEFKVGDRVEVVDEHDALYKQQGIVIDIQEDGDIYVKFHTSKHVKYKLSQLRKLPDTISFEDNPLERQVGGGHYKKCKIEPAEYIHANGLDFFQGNVVKYITRFRDKDGKKDLEKIKHYCDMLIQLEYPDPDFENVD